jgi:hypothetical protein
MINTTPMRTACRCTGSSPTSSIRGAACARLGLADALHISATPTFVAGKEVRRGLVDEDGMKRLIAAARGE